MNTPIFKTFFIFLFVFFLYTYQNVYAQDYYYKEYGINEGLPSSQVYDVYQDKNNFLWFATDRGLVRYNGYEFTTYGINEGLPGMAVLAFYPQDNGEIWCATLNKKLFYFNEQFDGFYNYSYNDKINEVLNTTIQKIEYVYKDSQENIYLGIAQSDIGYIIISKKGKLNIADIEFNKDSHTVTNINYIRDKQSKAFCYFTKSKKLPFKAQEVYTTPTIISTRLKATNLPSKKIAILVNYHGISLVNEHNITYKTIHNGYKPLCAVPLDDNHFIVGYYSKGASIFNAKGEVVETFFKNKSVTSFLKDHEGGYWFTTLNNGVYYIKNPTLKQITISGNKNNVINAIEHNRENELFVGNYNGDIYKIDHKKESHVIFETKKQRKSLLSFDKENNQMLLFNSYGVHQYKKDTLKLILSEYVRKISEKHTPYTIYSLISKLKIYKGNKEEKEITVNKRINDAAYKDEKILIGTNQGLFIYDTVNKLRNLADESPLFTYNIKDIDVHNTMDEFYLATLGKGLVVSTPDSTYSIQKKDGLLSNNINEIYLHKENEIWLATDGGVNRVIFGKNGRFKIDGLDSKRGLVSNEVRDITIIEDTLWIATKKGLIYTPTKNIEAPNIIKDLDVYIKGIRINDQQHDTHISQKLSHNENDISFFVEALSYQYEEQLQYSYTMEGLYDKWYPSSDRNIRFSSLPPGKYTFKVKVCTNQSECSEKITSYSFIIRPPFWSTWWFISILIILLLAIIYFFFKVRILTYNKDVFRELIRLLIKQFTKEKVYLLFREAGQDVRILTNTISYIKSSGNYIDIFTDDNRYTIRNKIGDFISITPDPLEYVRIHRFYVVRIDHIRSKSSQEVVLKNDIKLPVGKTYVSQIDKIQFL